MQKYIICENHQKTEITDRKTLLFLRFCRFCRLRDQTYKYVCLQCLHQKNRLFLSYSPTKLQNQHRQNAKPLKINNSISQLV